jgi:hypothetical protein
LMARGLMRSRRAGSRLSRIWRPMAPARSMVSLTMTPAAWMTWSRAACRAMVKLARSVPGAVKVVSVIAILMAW